MVAVWDVLTAAEVLVSTGINGTIAAYTPF